MAMTFSRVILGLTCMVPSLLCFGLSGYLVVNGNERAWGWFLFVGVLALSIPGYLMDGPGESQECLRCKRVRERVKKEVPEDWDP